MLIKNSYQNINSSFLPYAICGLACLFCLYDYLIQVVPSVMTNQLMGAFNIGAAKLGVLAACFYYSYTLMQIPAGYLLDRLGPRLLLTASVFVSACGAILFGATNIFALAGFARLLVGLGSAFAFVSAIFLVSRWFSHARFAMTAGIVQLVASLGSIVGLAPMAMLVNNFGWRETSLWTGGITFVLCILFWVVIRDGKPDNENIMIADHNIHKELLQIFKLPTVWYVAICGMASWIPVAVIGALWGVPYLMQVYGMTNTQAGNLCSLFWVGVALGSPLFGAYTDKIKKRCFPMSLCFSIGIVSSVMLLNAVNLPSWLTGISLFAIGLSSSVQSLSFGPVKDVVPKSCFGTATGFTNMAAIVGGAISQPLVGWILHLTWHGEILNGAPVYSVQSYVWGLTILPVSAVVGFFVSNFLIEETNCEEVSGNLVKG